MICTEGMTQHYNPILIQYRNVKKQRGVNPSWLLYTPMDHLNHVHLSSTVNSNLRLSIKKNEYTYNL